MSARDHRSDGSEHRSGSGRSSVGDASDLQRQIGTLWRMARTGLDSMREVVVRSSQFGKLRLDIALLHREREQLLVDIGLRVLQLLDDPDGADLPEDVHRLRDRVRDIEHRITSDTVKAHDNAFGAPRGFEPEAAVDYGDSDDADEDGRPAPAAAPAAAKKSKKPPMRKNRNGVKNL